MAPGLNVIFLEYIEVALLESDQPPGSLSLSGT